jgi:sulfate adenylyltransferase
MLIAPYRNHLVDLVDPSEESTRRALTLPSIQISSRTQCDLELLATGAFSPLDRFMGREDYERVVHEMRLADGTLWSIPITLPIEAGAPVHLDKEVVLRGSRNEILAIMTVTEIYGWDREVAARLVFGTTERSHPLVAEMDRWGELNISGPLNVLRVPSAPDFAELRRTPREVRALLEQRGRANIVAFQTRNPIHRAHEELTHRATEQVDGVLLLHPVVGMTKPGDVDHFTRVRSYKALVEKYYEPDRILLSLLPLAMRMAGPREALFHAIIRRNYGANHLIVGRDHASPGPFYGPYDAQELVARHEDETGVKAVAFGEMVYLADEDRYEEAAKIPAGARTASISGTQVRDQYLGKGVPLPAWFTRPEVAQILAESYPPRSRQGFCLWFTGLSGAGKSTTADAVVRLLMEHGRAVSVLDGDVVRTHLSKGLGFSKEDRDTNILRIGFVAAEVVRHGGVAVCAAVSPYQATREAVRAMVGSDRFFEIFVDTPLAVCESRDVKGMYAQARSGAIAHFTGISDPYEPPVSPEVTIETQSRSPEENARAILDAVKARGFVR